jgi:hypothetical protein
VRELRQSVIVLENPTAWRQLVSEYAALRQSTNGMSPQARGQRFNDMIAELLSVFAIPAKSNQLSVGELDVTFRHGNRPFILEAKWDQRKTGTGPIAKLQRRLEQRMSGVVGVFLSMKGYSDDALAEVDKGRRLDLVLLDQTHWEAMLSGFVPPEELLDLVTDAAAFRGQPFSSLHELLDQRADVPRIKFGAPSETSEESLPPGHGNIQAKTVLAGLESRQLGIAEDGDDKLLLTVDQGVLAVDLGKQRARWAVPVAGCADNPLPLPDGSILVTRAHGVGRFRSGQVMAMSSGSGLRGRPATPSAGRHRMVLGQRGVRPRSYRPTYLDQVGRGTRRRAVDRCSVSTGQSHYGGPADRFRCCRGRRPRPPCNVR